MEHSQSLLSLIKKINPDVYVTGDLPAGAYPGKRILHFVRLGGTLQWSLIKDGVTLSSDFLSFDESELTQFFDNFDLQCKSFLMECNQAMTDPSNFFPVQRLF